MTERQAIEAKLRRKEAEIQSLEEKVKAARVYVQALRDVLKMLGKAEDDADTQPTEAVLRAGSAVALARDTIITRGAPVHINDLLGAQGKEITRENRASLTSSLSAYVRRGEIFTRPAPNTFGLAELGHTEESPREDEPPRDFGKVEEEPKRTSYAEELDEDVRF